MKKIIPLLVIIIVNIVFGASYPTKSDEVIMQALTDELDRSMNELKTEELSAPYYISYGVTDSWSAYVRATFGAIIDYKDPDRSRRLNIDLRIGDYKYDNSNFEEFGFSMSMLGGGMNMDYGDGSLPLMDDYDAIRRQIWRSTDRAFKEAHEIIIEKDAAIENMAEPPQTDDWSPAEEAEFFEQPTEFNFDMDFWKKTARNISVVFKEYPSIRDCSVYVGSGATRNYMCSSEGARIITQFDDVLITVSATAIDDNGHEFSDNIFYLGNEESDLPDESEIIKDARELAQTLSKRIETDTLDTYTGPVFFEGQAAAEVWLSTIGEKLCAQDEPIVADERMRMALSMMQNQDYAKRIDKRVLPEYISVVDDPFMKEYDGTELIGYYEYDNEGVKAQKVNLIEDGMVKTILTHRIPKLEVPKSNGHGRVGIIGKSSKPLFSNLIVKSKETLSREKILKEMETLLEDEGLEYGLIVKKVSRPMDESTAASSLMEQFMPMMGGGGQKSSNVIPVNVYKYDPKTKEETLLRQMRISDIGNREMKNIVAVSDNENVYNVRILMSGMVPASIIAPDILFEELELNENIGEKKKTPELESPFHR